MPVQPLLVLPLCRMQIIHAAGSTGTPARQPVCLLLPGRRQLGAGAPSKHNGVAHSLCWTDQSGLLMALGWAALKKCMV